MVARSILFLRSVLKGRARHCRSEHMRMAWGRKTGGRKKGTPNKRTSVLAAKTEAAVAGSEGEMPLDYMIRVMRDPTTEPHRRDAMGKAAAPYVQRRQTTPYGHRCVGE